MCRVFVYQSFSSADHQTFYTSIVQLLNHYYCVYILHLIETCEENSRETYFANKGETCEENKRGNILQIRESCEGNIREKCVARPGVHSPHLWATTRPLHEVKTLKKPTTVGRSSIYLLSSVKKHLGIKSNIMLFVMDF